MNLEQAQIAFDDFLKGVDEYKVADFLNYIRRRWFISECSGEKPALAYMRLRNIADDVKKLVPFNAILPSEKIIHPTTGENADCDPRHTEHVDAFLYEEYEIDELEKENKINKSYCKDCSSRNIAPLTFISHSASRRRVEFIFCSLLPHLDRKCVLDVGSRLGALLYGAYVYTDANKIIGVEINEDLCIMQRQIIDKHKMSDRIEVIQGDICSYPDIVANADVILLNNVFEFFQTEDQQTKAWKFLRSHITKPKTLLVTVPTLEKSIRDLKTGIDLTSWVKKVPIKDPLVVMSMESQDELSEICLYEVL